MLLEANDLEVSYGPVKALSNVSFHVDDGEVVAMIGPNGAGKSTAIKAVAGLLDYFNGKLVGGSVHFDGANITDHSADRLARMGIGVVPEGRRIFGSMTVAENLEMGGYLLATKADISHSMELVLQLFGPLKRLLKRTAGALSGGEQQMLAIGRALMLRPRLLIADEVSLGLSPNYVETIGAKIGDIKEAGTAVLLVEQNVALALAVSHRTYVFKMGGISFADSSQRIRQETDLRSFFLGGVLDNT